jgi:hypothetical protein
MRRTLRCKLWIFLTLSVSIAGVVTAQDTCPAIAEQAITAASDACGTLGRNQACYGNNAIQATDWTGAELEDFNQPGHITNLLDMQSISTLPFDAETHTWGIAMLAIQANLSSSLPGQNVHVVVFGDVQVENETAPESTASDADDQTPMGAFRIQTGLGGTSCDEVPNSGLLVQTPGDSKVNLLVNGVEMSIGSTALIRLNDTALRVATLDGEVSVTSGSQTTAIERGTRVDIPPGAAPSEPETYDYDEVRSLPLGLLPEAIDLEPPAGVIYSIISCSWPGQESVSTDETLILRRTVEFPDEASAADMRENAALTVTLDGEPVRLYSIVGPVALEDSEDPDEQYRVRHYWVLPNLTPGEHQLSLRTTNVTLPEGQDYDSDCTIQVDELTGV